VLCKLRYSGFEILAIIQFLFVGDKVWRNNLNLIYFHKDKCFLDSLLGSLQFPDLARLMFKIVIVDDHPSTREGLSTRIEIEPDLQVCGMAADLDEGMQEIEKHRPDLVIVDVSLRSGNGIELTKQIRKRFESVKVLVWSMYDESLYGDRAMRAGAMGYINKEMATDAIIGAINTVLNGNSFFSPELSSKLFRRMISGEQASNATLVESLSDRELETFRLIGHGYKTKEIAKKLKISPKTVETYRARIKEKLGLHDMSSLAREAAHWVLENG